MLIVSTPVPLILHVSLADVYVDARPSEVTCSFIGWATARVIYTIDPTSWLEFLINEGG